MQLLLVYRVFCVCVCVCVFVCVCVWAGMQCFDVHLHSFSPSFSPFLLVHLRLFLPFHPSICFSPSFSVKWWREKAAFHHAEVSVILAGQGRTQRWMKSHTHTDTLTHTHTYTRDLIDTLTHTHTHIHSGTLSLSHTF